MVKGTVQKIETLQDGSIKVSIYVPKEQIIQAFPLAYKEVVVTLIQEELQDMNRTRVLTSIRNSIDDIKGILERELCPNGDEVTGD